MRAWRPRCGPEPEAIRDCGPQPAAPSPWLAAPSHSGSPAAENRCGGAERLESPRCRFRAPPRAHPRLVQLTFKKKSLSCEGNQQSNWSTFRKYRRGRTMAALRRGRNPLWPSAICNCPASATPRAKRGAQSGRRGSAAPPCLSMESRVRKDEATAVGHTASAQRAGQGKRLGDRADRRATTTCRGCGPRRNQRWT